ncbi:MAG: hypothetical protein U0414_43275 [Polyangiaceae bacterium]
MADTPPLALEPYATLRAEIDAGEEVLAVIDREKISESTWSSAQAFWLKKMADEAESKRFETTNRYQALYIAKKKIFESRRARKKAKEQQPPVQEPAAAPLDEAAKFLAAAALTEVPAIVVPKAPPPEVVVASPSFEVPALVRPPAPNIAPPARVGPMAAAGAPDRTAAASNLPSSGLPFAPKAPDALPFVPRPAFVSHETSDSDAPPTTLRAPAEGRTMAVDIDSLLREQKSRVGTPFEVPSAKPPTPVEVPSAKPATPFEVPVAKPATPFEAPAAKAATPFEVPAARPATPFEVPAARPATPFEAPAARPATPFEVPVAKPATPFEVPAAKPAAAASVAPPSSPGRPAPLPFGRAPERAIEALEDDDDDDAPKTMMLTEERAKALSMDIPMSSRPAAVAIAAAAVPLGAGDITGGEETLPPNAAVSALRDPGAGLPFQRAPSVAPQPAPMRAPASVVPAPSTAQPSTAQPPIAPPPPPDAVAAATKIFSIQQFASLTAEIAVNPERIAEIRSRYGVSEAQHKAESQRWTEEFATNTELRQRYFGLVQTYREYLQKQK